MLGVYKTAVLTFQESKAVLTYLLLIFLSHDLCFEALKISVHPQLFSLETIPQLAVYFHYSSLCVPALISCTMCMMHSDHMFFNSVEAGGTASSSCLEVSAWPVGKGGAKDKDDTWCLHEVMIQVCWMWNDLGYNYRNTANLWKIISGKDLPQSWHTRWFALLLNVRLRVSYSLGHSATGSGKYQLRTFQTEIQTLASQSHWSGSHQRNHDLHRSRLLEKPCILWLGNERHEIYLQTASWGGLQSLHHFDRWNLKWRETELIKVTQKSQEKRDHIP